MDKELYINDKRIDAQHEELFEILDIDLRKNTREELSNILSKLYKHTVIHFFEEEAVMKAHNMPRSYIHRHARIHDILREELRAFKTHLYSSTQEDMLKFISIFREKMVNHVKTVDIKMNKYL